MIALGLDVILVMLLMCGLLMGMRLDKRLRGLRESHAGFAKAVEELDQAAVRTEASLAALRAGAEQARTDLAARIDQARLLTQRLDKLNTDAERVLDKPLPLPLTRAAPRGAAEPVASRPAAEPRLQPQALAQPSLRSRVVVDDDLFDVGGGLDRRPREPLMAPRVAAIGGRR